MIRINLLPVRAAKKKELGKVQIALGLIVVLAAGGGNYAWHVSKQNEIERIRTQIARTQQEIRQLEEIIGQVKDIEERKAQVERKLKVLDELRAGKTGPVMMMDSLATLVPTEVWVERFNEAGGTLQLDGRAMRHEDLAAFISALNESPYFTSVQLRQATLETRDGRQTVRFTISGQVVYTAQSPV
jgi:type IV pilus assembly protein PilN